MGINNETVVKEQYENAGKLNTRISIHEKYSTNKQGFGTWIVSNYNIKQNSRILELGCGTGDMWKNHLSLLDKGSQLYLTDFSGGMVEYAKASVGEVSNIIYEVVNVENIPYEDNSFDIVIANMMLYHVPNLEKGLAEIKRVLKDDGIFYCATYGENGFVEYIADLLSDYGVRDETEKSFTLQNGGIALKKYFSDVQRLDYKDSLAVTNLEDLLDYIYSLNSMTNVTEIKREVLKEILEKHMEQGVLHLPKEYGMFVCRK